ncbi:cytochrome c oxidase subunit I [Anaeromyxobacter diazotrophicus]|uniref:Cytochrome-c oxidase n=1 Tax=Anaeromyxobacter diazotrophicus TaxID=2590199 RepID=A0A7I9VL11_9BACT|nr:cbb3-type cytochrome c oxidase subunit I [Anaeromyxobacter diazotrophicus]GEJ56789.1 cytochrome-c oxidase [Anaeromyxobacter diazotrophicus]
MATPAQALWEAAQPIHPQPTAFWRRYVFSIDHKVIGKQFLWAGLLFMLVGGGMAMLIRWQWAFPYRPVPVVGRLLFPASGGVIGPATYQTLFTTHGLIMIFFAVTPVLIGAFGNFLIPLMIGARDMAFPRLNMYSFWSFLLSQLLVLASFATDLGTAGAGWTTYAPLSTNVGTPGLGQTLVILAIFVTGVSSTMGAVNYVTTVIRLRAPGMTWMRLPLTIWGLWLTAVLNALFIPVLGSAALLLLFDRNFGTQFFVAGASSVAGGGDPIIYQHLFWIFGHPEVYIMILPAWGILGDVLAVFSRKPHHWYRGTVGALVAVTVLSALVYGHHMFLTGMSPLLGEGFMLFTLVISVPSMIVVLNWLFTIWGGSLRFDTPMLFALGTMVLFGVGGLTGLFLGDISMDLYLHDTLFVVGHFHFTMAAGSFMGAMTGLYFWFPKMFGRRLDERLGKAHFWFSFLGLALVFGGQLLAGWAGQQRRLFDPFQYTFIQGLRGLNRWTSYFAFALFAGQLAFVVNFFKTVFGRGQQQAGDNPWQATTLEWTATRSPPPFHNFDHIPLVVRGPYELSSPEVQRLTGRDFAGQAEELPVRPDAAAGGA